MRHQAIAIALALCVATPVFAQHLEASSPPAKKTKVTTIARFRPGEIYVHTDERVRLRELAALWQATSSDSVLVVEGNGSIADDEERNIALGQRRADLVRSWLIKFGVDSHHVIAIGNARQRLDDDVDIFVMPPGA
jgi:outer membrane protein OmpA-like peptidoglycan-associated protein